MITDDGYELVHIDHEAAMKAPKDVYFDQDGVTAYSCLIPQNFSVAKRIHFVSGSDGDEYGQFKSEARAKDEAAAVLRLLRKNLETGSLGI